MNIDAGVGGRHRKNDPRDTRNWIGKLNMRATREGDQFVLAAVYRALIGQGSKRLTEAIRADAKKCLADHQKNEERTGIQATIEAV